MVRVDVPLRVTVPDEVSPHTTEHLRRVLRDAADHAPAPVLHATGWLAVDHNPSNPKPVTAKGRLDVNGRLVRAQIHASRPDEAIDLLEARIRHNLDVLARHRLARRHLPPGLPIGEWRHGALPSQRPPYFPRPVDEREIVRHKTYEMTPLSIDEAALETQLLDHDFHLFVEAGTGQDACVERLADGGYRVTLAGHEGGPRLEQPSTDIQLVRGAPRMALGDALTMLDAGGLDRVFFVDVLHGRGAVAYRRYDGHYGILVAHDGGMDNREVRP